MPDSPIIIDQYQVALFPSANTQLPKVVEIIEGVSKLGIFDQQKVNLIPIPDSAPSEIVRLEEKSADGSIQLKYAPGKMSFYWINLKKDYGYRLNNTSIENVIRPFLAIFDSLLTFKRVGFITSVYRRVDNPTEQILNRYPNLRTAQEPFINFFASADYYIEMISSPRRDKNNRHMSFGVGTLNGELEPNGVVSVQQDINTHQSIELSFTSDQVFTYLNEALGKSSAQDIYSRIMGDT